MTSSRNPRVRQSMRQLLADAGICSKAHCVHAADTRHKGEAEKKKDEQLAIKRQPLASGKPTVAYTVGHSFTYASYVSRNIGEKFVRVVVKKLGQRRRVEQANRVVLMKSV